MVLQRYRCDICGKALRSSQTLKDHKLVIHFKQEKVKSVICDLCGAAFQWKKGLRKHMEKEYELKSFSKVVYMFYTNVVCVCFRHDRSHNPD